MTGMKTTFYVTIEEGADKKTNVYKLKWIQPINSELYYEFPSELQEIKLHPELLNIQKVKNVLKCIKSRGAYRTFTITLLPEVNKLYFDEEDDVVYKDIYLTQTSRPTHLEKEMTKKRELSETVSHSIERKLNLTKIRNSFVLDQFNGKIILFPNGWKFLKKNAPAAILLRMKIKF